MRLAQLQQIGNDYIVISIRYGLSIHTIVEFVCLFNGSSIRFAIDFSILPFAFHSQWNRMSSYLRINKLDQQY